MKLAPENKAALVNYTSKIFTKVTPVTILRSICSTNGEE